MLYSETHQYEDKVEVLFHLMADEQENIFDKNDAMISCSRGPAKRVIEILTTLASKHTAEIIKDSLKGANEDNKSKED